MFQIVPARILTFHPFYFSLLLGVMQNIQSVSALCIFLMNDVHIQFSGSKYHFIFVCVSST